MSLTCDILKQNLEGHFCMPFEVSVEYKQTEKHFVCYPSNEGEMFFVVDISIKNDIRLLVNIYPQRHGGYIIQDMAKATPEKKSTFFYYLQMIADKGAKVNFKVDDTPISESSWPLTWRNFNASINLSPIPEEEEQSREDFILEWLLYSFELIFSLLNITDVNEPNAIQSEGTASEIKAIRYERNPINRRLCLHSKGYNCCVCGMNFFETYGEIGYHYIEVHHTVPVSMMDENYIFKIDDLVPLCSNCHSMIHRQTPPLSVEALKQILDAHKK